MASKLRTEITTFRTALNTYFRTVFHSFYILIPDQIINSFTYKITEICFQFTFQVKSLPLIIVQYFRFYYFLQGSLLIYYFYTDLCSVHNNKCSIFLWSCKFQIRITLSKKILHKNTSMGQVLLNLTMLYLCLLI